jgi:hypothetical protein
MRCLDKGYECIVEPVSGPTISSPSCSDMSSQRSPPTDHSHQSSPDDTQWCQGQPMFNTPFIQRAGSGGGGGGTRLDEVQGGYSPSSFNSTLFPSGTTHAPNYGLHNPVGAWDAGKQRTEHRRSRRTSHHHSPSSHNLYLAPVARSPSAGTHDYVNHGTGHVDDRGGHSDSSGHSPERFPYQAQYVTAAPTQYHPHTMNHAGAGNFYSGQSAHLASNSQNQWSAAVHAPMQKYERSRCP